MDPSVANMNEASARLARWRGIFLFALSLALVLLIAFARQRGWLAGIDRALMGGAGVFRDTILGSTLTPVMLAATAIGGTASRVILVLTACVAFIRRNGTSQARWLLAVVIGGALLNLALKQIFAAPRPDLLPHLDMVDTYSFPSGHAAGNMIFFGALAMLLARRWTWIAATLSIALIGISRVWLGVHWPSDVLAGWIEGIGWLILCGALLRR